MERDKMNKTMKLKRFLKNMMKETIMIFSITVVPFFLALYILSNLVRGEPIWAHTIVLFVIIVVEVIVYVFVYLDKEKLQILVRGS